MDRIYRLTVIGSNASSMGYAFGARFLRALVGFVFIHTFRGQLIGAVAC